MTTVGFAGLSHLGVVSSLALACKGFDVVGYDADLSLTADLAAGRTRFYELGLDALIEQGRSRICFTSDLAVLARCDVIYISLDVPTDDAGTSDLSGLRRLIDAVGQASANSILVVLSQVPPGFTRARAEQWRAEGLVRALFYQVETLVMGDAVRRAISPERLIVGTPNPRFPLPAAYNEVLSAFGCPILPMRYESAELAKISINVCLAASVSVANTLAEICERIGADWSEIVPALRLDRRIGPYAYLIAGLGIGGGNIGRDLATVQSLAGRFGTDATLIRAIETNSLYRREWALRTVHGLLGRFDAGVTVALWGLAYKADTTFTKNSPAVGLATAIRLLPVRAYDPQVPLDAVHLPTLTRVSSALEACGGADILAVMTPWNEFRSVDLSCVRAQLSQPIIVDPYGVLDAEECAALGFEHFRLGAAPRHSEVLPSSTM
jgi:UDPglucose 6-dehydrogenase